GRAGPGGVVMEPFGAVVPRTAGPVGTGLPAPVATPAGPAPGSNTGVVGPLDAFLPDMRPILEAARGELPADAHARLGDAATELMADHAHAKSGAGLTSAVGARFAEIEKASAPPEGSAAEKHLANQLLALGAINALLTRPDQVMSAAAGDNALRAVFGCAAVVINDLGVPDAEVLDDDGVPAEESVEETAPRLFETQDGEEPHIIPFDET